MATKRAPLAVDREYLRLGEIVQLTGLSQTFVRQEIDRGHLEAFRVGRAVLVPHDAVDRWIRGEDSQTRQIAA